MKLAKLGVILVGIGSSLLVSAIALAGETTVTGANGKSSTVNRNVSKDGGTTNVNRNTTYSNGQTSSSTSNFTSTGNGNYTGTTNRTNRQGETTNYQLNGQLLKENGTRQNTGTLTNSANGNQTSFNNSGSCINGACTGNRITTFPNGKTRTTALTGTRMGAGTFNGTANVTGRNGKSRTGTFQRVR
jgi:hypothetical protein